MVHLKRVQIKWLFFCFCLVTDFGYIMHDVIKRKERDKEKLCRWHQLCIMILNPMEIYPSMAWQFCILRKSNVGLKIFWYNRLTFWDGRNLKKEQKKVWEWRNFQKNWFSLILPLVIFSWERKTKRNCGPGRKKLRWFEFFPNKISF